MKSFRIWLRKYHILHKVISSIYRTLFQPIINGYYKGMLQYNLFIKKHELRLLKSKGFKNIKKFKKKSWKFGNNSDNVFRRYYTAEYSDKLAFVKIAKNDLTLLNEIELAAYIKDYDLPFVSKTYCYDYHFSDNTAFLASEYSENLKPFNSISDNILLNELFKQYNYILEKLEEIGIVHADIHENNLMINNSNNLTLIDFGISIIKGKNTKIDYIARPGTFYKTSDDGKKRIYDDAYSFIKMCERCYPDKNLQYNEEYKKIADRIGKNTAIIIL